MCYGGCDCRRCGGDPPVIKNADRHKDEPPVIKNVYRHKNEDEDIDWDSYKKGVSDGFALARKLFSHNLPRE